MDKVGRRGFALAATVASILSTSFPAGAEEERRWVEVPLGWRDSKARAMNIGHGGRELETSNISPDVVSIDVWDRGMPIWGLHRESYDGDIIEYGVAYDATVTRWRDCHIRCEIAGVYKYSAWNDRNGYLDPSVYPLIPRPTIPHPR